MKWYVMQIFTKYDKKVKEAIEKEVEQRGYQELFGRIIIPKEKAEYSMDAAACIGCGACVAACKNASAMLFVAAKVSHFALLPQGRAEAAERVQAMVAKMDELGFGNCTNTGACEAECPKLISIDNIARMNREFLGAKIGSQKKRWAQADFKPNRFFF